MSHPGEKDNNQGTARVILFFPVDRDTHKFFAAFRVTFLMQRVCFKPITWYIEMHHVRTCFSVWHHGFFVLRDVHSKRVYLQEESLPPFYHIEYI